MIDAKDLRVGNWVWYKEYPCKVDAICDLPNKKEVSIKGDHLLGELKFQEIDPIPLSTELLIKCGFKYTGYGYDFPDKWRLYLDFYCKGKFGIFVKQGDRSSDISIGGDIKYVHQLQNLTYCLTGIELNIKL